MSKCTEQPADLIAISIVTPAFNAARYIAETIGSVLSQGYSNLEYVVVDGGSTDGTVDIIRAQADRLADWLSEPDEGMYDALNKGFPRTCGEVMGWINADDIYLPGTLHTVGEMFSRFPQVEWLTTHIPIAIDERGSVIKINRHAAFSSHGFIQGEHFPHAGWPAECFLQQEGTFWRRSLWDRVGGRMDASCRLAGDFDLWCRFALQSELVSIDVPLGAFRYHTSQQTSVNLAKYLDEAKRSYAASGLRPPSMLSRLQVRARRLLSDRAWHWLADKGVVRSNARITYDWAGRQWVMKGLPRRSPAANPAGDGRRRTESQDAGLSSMPGSS